MSDFGPLTLLALLKAALLAGVAVSFALAAVAKLKAPADFLSAVAAYRLLPEPMLEPAARTLPWLELLAALLLAGSLFIPALLPPAAALAGGLLLLFALAMAVNLRRGRTDLDCGCGGRPRPISRGLAAQHLLLAALLAVASTLPLPALAAATALVAALAGLAILTLIRAIALIGSAPTAGLLR